MSVTQGVKGAERTPTRIGISVDRWHNLNSADPAFKTWAQGVLPAVRDTFELVALDEGGTRWKAVKLSWPTRVVNHEIVTFDTIVHTPPARAEWLEVLE